MKPFVSRSPKTSFRFQAVSPVWAILTFALAFSPGPAHAVEPIGRLEARVLEVYRYGRHFSTCDTAPNVKTVRLQIARALDRRALEFLEVPPAHTRPGYRFDGVKIGNLKLKSRPVSARSEESPSSGAGWVSSFSGWSDYEKEFRTIRKQPMIARWVRLRARVIETIGDDEKRIFDGKWMQLSSQGVEEAPVLAKAIDDCQKDKTCDDLALTNKFSQALLLTRNMKSFYDAAQNAEAGKAKSTALTKLANEVSPYVTYFDPVPLLKGIRFLENNTLMIPVDVGDLSGYETPVSTLITRFWNQAGFHLIVDWIKSTRELPLFTFSLGDRFGIPSQVNLRARRLTLSSDGYESTPAHAIGQALGFRPRVFSIWRSDRCQYEDQSNPSDLMSDLRTGTVNAGHWESLKKIYAR